MALRAVAVAVWVALAAVCAVVFTGTGEAVVNALGCAVIVAITVTDIERRVIPNRIVLPALVAALVVQTVREPSVSSRGGQSPSGRNFTSNRVTSS